MGAFNGVGQFIRSFSWANDAANNIDISSSRMDTEDNGFAAGLSNCLTRDGQSPALGNIPMGGYRLTGLGNGINPQDAVSYSQLLLATSINLKTYGALGDGVTDDTTAIQNWLNAGATGAPLFAPPGTYIFTAALVLTNPTGLVINGAGPYATVFKYAGASTTVDLISIGTNAGAATNNISLSNFRFTSSTTMTAGAGLHLQQVTRSNLNNVIADGQDGTGKLYIGFWFDQTDIVTLDGFQASASNDGLRVNGGIGARPKADLFINNGKIAPANSTTMTCGVHVAGAFGGLQVGAVDIIGSKTNMIVDTAVTAESNREITFSALAALDTSTVGPCLLLNDGGSGTVYVAGAGTWFASAATNAIQINSTTCNYKIILAGGRLYNNANDGILNNSAIAEISVTGAEINNNVGTGIANPGGGLVKIVAPNFAGNGANTSGDVYVIDLATTLTIANGGSVAFPVGAGMFSVCAQNFGNHVASYVCGGGGSAMLGSSGATWVASTTTPAAGHASVAFNGSAYAVYNNTGGSLTVGYSNMRLNNGT